MASLLPSLGNPRICCTTKNKCPSLQCNKWPEGVWPGTGRQKRPFSVVAIARDSSSITGSGGDGVAQKEPSRLQTENHLKFPQNLAAKSCDYLERAIVWYFDDYANKKKHPWFEGNYAPTTEMAPKDQLPVTGTIPVTY